MLTRERFLAHLHEALDNLYDPDRLCKSPLASLFGVANRFDTYPALQKVLLEAIASLKPQAGTPPQQRAWRIYELLFNRYVQQYTARTVADQLGVTVRHLRREQGRALQALAYHLWQQYGLEGQVCADEGDSRPSEAVGSGTMLDEDLAWIRDTQPEEPPALNQTLCAVSELAQPWAAQHRVLLDLAPAEDLALAVHQVALSQTILNLLNVAIPRAVGGQVHLSSRSRPWEAEIRVESRLSHVGRRASDEEANLDMARRLAGLLRCRLDVSDDGDRFTATLTVPALQQVLVLAIDDNADALQLFDRFVAGTRYRMVGTRDPQDALPLAQRLAPQIIVLDVMMPRIDGWRVLAQLHQHPATSHIPIVVCTVLPQEGMALSLGASGFVRKPITQEAFLAALDRHVDLQGSEPR